jgi:hypothetical protein
MIRACLDHNQAYGDFATNRFSVDNFIRRRPPGQWIARYRIAVSLDHICQDELRDMLGIVRTSCTLVALLIIRSPDRHGKADFAIP